MATPLKDAVDDTEVAVKIIKGVAPITLLALAVLVLVIALGFTIVTAKVGGDRWTRTDHMLYVQGHDEESAKLVEKLVNNHNAVHSDAMAADHELDDGISSLHTEVAVLKTTVDRMERDIQLIKAAVIK